VRGTVNRLRLKPWRVRFPENLTATLARNFYRHRERLTCAGGHRPEFADDGLNDSVLVQRLPWPFAGTERANVEQPKMRRKNIGRRFAEACGTRTGFWRQPQKNDFVGIKPVACVIAYSQSELWVAFYKNLLNGEEIVS